MHAILKNILKCSNFTQCQFFTTTTDILLHVFGVELDGSLPWYCHIEMICKKSLYVNEYTNYECLNEGTYS